MAGVKWIIFDADNTLWDLESLAPAPPFERRRVQSALAPSLLPGAAARACLAPQVPPGGSEGAAKPFWRVGCELRSASSTEQWRKRRLPCRYASTNFAVARAAQQGLELWAARAGPLCGGVLHDGQDRLRLQPTMRSFRSSTGRDLRASPCTCATLHAIARPPTSTASGSVTITFAEPLRRFGPTSPPVGGRLIEPSTSRGHAAGREDAQAAAAPPSGRRPASDGRARPHCEDGAYAATFPGRAPHCSVGPRALPRSAAAAQKDGDHDRDRT
jgi:hypothetical protein